MTDEKPDIMDVAVDDVARLLNLSTSLVNAISHDDNGSMVGDRWMGGNGGLLSRDTLAAADALRLELARWK